MKPFVRKDKLLLHLEISSRCLGVIMLLYAQREGEEDSESFSTTYIHIKNIYIYIHTYPYVYIYGPKHIYIFLQNDLGSMRADLLESWLAQKKNNIND